MEATSRESASPAAVLRVVAVVLISLYYVATTLPDIVLPWHPTAGFGFVIDAAGNVIDVDPRSSAGQAGVRAGDRANFAKTPIEPRRYLIPGVQNIARPGARADFVFQRGGADRTIRLVAQVSPRSLADNITDVFFVVSEVGLALIAAGLLLLRPSRMTWAFFSTERARRV